MSEKIRSGLSQKYYLPDGSANPRRESKGATVSDRIVKQMKPWSLLCAALIGLASYFTLELFFGSYGLVAYRLMEDYRAVARDELEHIAERHAALERQIRLLSGNAETIRLEARDSGLIRPDEYVVRIEGREPRPRHRYLPGSLPPAVPVSRDNRPLFRSIALAVSLVFLLVDTLSFQPRMFTLHRRRDEGSWEVEVDGEDSGA